jgi:hypothetical protein
MKRKKVQRGKCPVCRFSFRLDSEGYLYAHTLYQGMTQEPFQCSGGYLLPDDPERSK